MLFPDWVDINEQAFVDITDKIALTLTQYVARFYGLMLQMVKKDTQSAGLILHPEYFNSLDVLTLQFQLARSGSASPAATCRTQFQSLFH